MEILAILLLAVIVESFVEYAFGKVKPLKNYLLYISLAFGIVVSIAYRVDVIDYLVGIQSPIPYFGYILSGLLIGRGSNYINDLVSLIKGDFKKS
jgi:hypothetical protein